MLLAVSPEVLTTGETSTLALSSLDRWVLQRLARAASFKSQSSHSTAPMYCAEDTHEATVELRKAKIVMLCDAPQHAESVASKRRDIDTKTRFPQAKKSQGKQCHHAQLSVDTLRCISNS